MIATTTATDTHTTEEVLQDVQRLLALRPPTDPATGLMEHDTRQAAQYREALRDIVDRYDSIESFQEAMRNSGAGQDPRLAPAAAPNVPGSYSLANGPPAPNPVAGVPAAVSLARFAQNMMAPGPPINPNAQGPQGAPDGAVPGMPAPMPPGVSLPATAGVARNAGLPAVTPRRGTGMIG